MPKEKPIRMTVRVQPNASHNAAVRLDDGILHVRIKAPPVGGKANQALIVFLSDVLGVRKSAMSIEKGERSRMKVIAFEGLTPATLKERLEDLFT